MDVFNIFYTKETNVRTVIVLEEKSMTLRASFCKVTVSPSIDLHGCSCKYAKKFVSQGIELCQDDLLNITKLLSHLQGPDFDDMSSFFPCEIDVAIQYINLGYGAQAPKIVIL